MENKYQWLDKSEFPFTSQCFNYGGINQHYIDVGEGDVVLFVHGTPSWSFDFRNVIKILSKSCRCIAIDHIGFGLSDKPEEYDYSTKNHSRRLGKFIEYLELKKINLVLHDFGGPIGFSYALESPENIESIVVLNSWLWSSSNDREFIKLKWILKSPIMPFLYKYFNFSARFLLPQSFGEKPLSKRLLKQYIKPFASRDERNGTIAFARSLLNDQEWFETLWNNREVLSGKAVLFIWGMKDNIVTRKYLNKFLAGFPDAHVLRLEGSGHFPQEEEPEKVADRIMSFIQV